MTTVVAQAIYWFSELICVALLIRALLSWFAGGNYNFISQLYMITVKFTEPFVAPCRKLLSRFNTGVIDFSVFLALILVQFGANLLIRLIYLIF